MPVAPSSTGHLRLLRSPGVPGVVLPSVLARLPVGMTTVLLVLLVQQRTGSYRVAGLAVALNSLAFAAVSPWYGRLADRGHAALVIAAAGVLQVPAMAGLLLSAGSGSSAWAVVLWAAAVGGASPPVAAITRALWPRLLDDTRLHPVAYNLEAVLVDLLYVLGPLLAGLAYATAGAAAGLAVASGAVLVGSIGLACSPAIRGYKQQPGPAPTGHVLAEPALRSLLAACALLSVAYVMLEVLIPAFAVEHHAPAAGGLLVAVWAVASVLGGMAYMRRDWRSALTRRLVVLVAANAGGFAALALAHGVWQLAVLLCLGGVLMAPATSVEYELVGRLTQAGRATEAFAWFGTAAYGAGGIGGVLAGVLVRPLGTDGAFLVPGAFALLAVVPAWWLHRMPHGAEHRPASADGER